MPEIVIDYPSFSCIAPLLLLHFKEVLEEIVQRSIRNFENGFEQGFKSTVWCNAESSF